MLYKDTNYIQQITFEQIKALTLDCKEELLSFDKQFGACEVAL